MNEYNYLYIYEQPDEPTAQRWNDETVYPNDNPYSVPTVTCPSATRWTS